MYNSHKFYFEYEAYKIIFSLFLLVGAWFFLDNYIKKYRVGEMKAFVCTVVYFNIFTVTQMVSRSINIA